MITIDGKPHVIVTHPEEVEEKVAQNLQPQIVNAVSSAVGSLLGEDVDIKGDIFKGLNISATFSNDHTTLEDLFMEENIEDAVSNTIDFGIGTALDTASREVAAQNPQDLL